MATIWKGAISFGLVHIPIRLETATSEYTPSFRMLHAKDNSTVKTQRVCEKEGKVIEWNDIVKGYEYEPGKFVVMSPDDFKAAEALVTRTIDIMDFVDESEIDARFYDRPYYTIPQPGGEKAYALLRRAIRQKGRVGVARVVLRNREHLAALKVVGDVLVLNLMRFPAEIASADTLEVPGDEGLKDKEVKMAVQLVDQLSGEFEPEKYRDDYTEKLLEVIRAKVEGKEIVVPEAAEEEEAEVIDLVSRLKESLEQGRERKAAQGSKARKRASRKSKTA
ncbi:MAG: Ku protein [Gemmatimonadota bacterium]